MLVVVLVLENFDRFAIRLTEQISSIGLFAVTKSQCTEDEHDDDDSKFRNLGQNAIPVMMRSTASMFVCFGSMSSATFLPRRRTIIRSTT